MMEFTQLIQLRRSDYDIDDQVTIPKNEITQMIEDIISNSPTAYNAQSFQVLVLYDEHHHTLWDALEREQPGFGTIVLFADNDAIEKRMPTTPDRQEIYKNQDSAILAYALWLGLNNINLGATLHHFNIGDDHLVRDLFDLPDSWEMIAQMPFGRVVKPTPKSERLPAHQFITVLED